MGSPSSCFLHMVSSLVPHIILQNLSQKFLLLHTSLEFFPLQWEKMSQDFTTREPKKNKQQKKQNHHTKSFNDQDSNSSSIKKTVEISKNLCFGQSRITTFGPTDLQHIHLLHIFWRSHQSLGAKGGRKKMHFFHFWCSSFYTESSWAWTRTF